MGAPSRAVEEVVANQRPPLEVLYDEGPFVVVNKPAGLAATGRSLDDPRCVQAQVMEREGRAMWAVHQLDVGTSGAMLFVRKKSLVEGAQRALRAPAALKRYFAVCAGALGEKTTVVDAPLYWSNERRRQEVRAEGKASKTRVRVLDSGEGASTVYADLLTGRTHQVRVHLAYIGLPIAGDALYGQAAAQISRPALHAVRLRVAVGDRRLDVHAPLPNDMSALVRALGLVGPS